MEGLLRGQEQPELIEGLFSQSFDYQSRLVLFPVRHHSPACSYHLQQVIEEYRPEVILIEGPENASDLIKHMTAPGTKAPFCIYASFDDREGRVDGQAKKYRAYYPFLEYSPEFTAIREGHARNIPCRFIDLSFGEKLLNCTGERPREQTDSGEYTDELAWSLGAYYESLVERTGCRNFNELWELLFEIEGCHTTTKAFVRNLFYYCYYTGLYTSEEERKEAGDRAREQVMAQHVEKALANDQRVLVVTGGMHTVALAGALYADPAGHGKEAVKSVIRLSGEDSKAYLMPYSFEASDQASGYRSGMAFPYFYQQVWENVRKKRAAPYEASVLGFLIKTAMVLRKKQAVSMADEMQSFYMARGLAALRGKKECGAYELIDAVQSSFIKGDMNSHYQPALKQLFRLMSGMTVGQVDEGAGVPPLVLDFQAQCKRFRIPIQSTLKKEVRLDIYNKAEHQEKSRFFFQMQFLDTGFCTCLGSQEDNGSTGRILLRETWEYRYMPQIQSALIHVSAYGATLRQASLSQLARRIKEEHHTAFSLAGLLTAGWQLGLAESLESLYQRLAQVIEEDMDFVSVIGCFERLCAIENRAMVWSQTMLAARPQSFGDLKKLCLNRGFTLLYTVMGAAKDQEETICKKIQYLHQYFLEHAGWEESRFLADMETMAEDEQVNRAIAGVCFGVLLKRERLDLDEVFHRFASYVEGAGDAKYQAVSFLKGFFLVARDVVFVDDRLLLLLDQVIAGTDAQLFLSLLPELRLAFASFLPFETDRLAKQVAGIYGKHTSDILYEQAVDPEELTAAMAIDNACRAALEQWFGGLHETD